MITKSIFTSANADMEIPVLCTVHVELNSVIGKVLNWHIYIQHVIFCIEGFSGHPKI